MNTHLNHMVAVERSRDLDRKRKTSRATPIATPATSRNPSIVGVEGLKGWWQLRRPLRPV